jgi:prolipoprotein diacylglyceryltransferase
MFDFFCALLGYLAARLVWDAIRRMAARAGEMPIVWAFKTLCLLMVLCSIVGMFGMILIYAVSR